jgi:hypothetical protein
MCSLVGQPGVSDLGWKASDASKSGEGGAKGKGGGWRGPRCAGAWGAQARSRQEKRGRRIDAVCRSRRGREDKR